MSSSLIITILLFLLGLALIVKGGDWFVDAATWMAEASGPPAVSDWCDGRVLATHTAGDHRLDDGRGRGQYRYGNRQRHRLCNGKYRYDHGHFAHFPARRHPDESICRKGRFDVVSTLVLWLLCRDGVLSLPESLIVLALFVAFIIENIRSAKKTFR